MRHSHAGSSLLAPGLGIFPLALLALLTGAAPAARAAGPIVVTSLADTSGTCADSGTGSCTLRDALTFANANPGSDTIHFAVSGTITLTSALPAITDTLTIDGGAQPITVSGAGAYRVLEVNSSAQVSLIALTIANGYSAGAGGGGGLYNAGTLTVTNSTFSDNSASGLPGPYVGGYGGGIYNTDTGTLTVSSSTLSHNSASGHGGGGYGGGIYNAGMLTVTNSTLSHNSASGHGGGGYGGGITNAGTGTLTLTNSTFSDNSASGFPGGYGGGITNADTLTATNSTFSGNSATGAGGLYNTLLGALLLRNTLVANSLTGGDCGGTITANHYNLADDHTCDIATYTTTAALQLGPLQNNGGPTWTIALGLGSVAVDAGNDSVCPATDQRGITRPQGPHCDVGAYELGGKWLFIPLVLRP